MSTRSKFLILGAAGLLLVALAAHAKPSQAKRPMPVVRTAVIENTGSTNTQGYRIMVSSAGTAEYMATERRGGVVRGKAQRKTLSTPLVKRLFHDLDAAGPLSDLTVNHGAKSASFGTSVYITYKNQRSPDLSFGGDAQATALKADIDAITQALHVTNTPRHRA